ncbi:hypothetical protein EI42_04335 [Thermosporothrix hazakensis]|jgi:predicted glycoside hydrolase/deacetylase ChbG (UPF0249 family)|uniref:Glycoside hydrolase/deacetylase ChbG (UPF0249 family) n=1 Tax=Thermosporothrix hazakensis TaxID=644383 RepID=A0A326U3C9_THEHA|nr:ChbG/HpnK family deacetylase [Thermosporothrix hazakensis]PZW25283.1 hypothetical protein EI42_04335 [Thermosporothrix hazakensis]GCE50515.1 hypothetical protein KTH_53840 [Thermosporothrix hazakensis]
MTDGEIRLITRGDDCGMFRAGNLAIVDAFERGILRNASIMVPAPQFEHAARLLKNRSGLCLGLHVTLTAEWDRPRWGAVSPPETVSSLLDEDQCFFRSSMELFQHGVEPEEVVREVRAQLARARSYGLDIRYLDEHMGIGWVYQQHDPEIRWRIMDALRELAQQEGLIWTRDLVPTLPAPQSVAELRDLLTTLSEGTYLLITHPASASQEIHLTTNRDNPVPGQVARARQNDYALLCHQEILRVVQEQRIRLTRYDEIAMPCTSTM